jgi:hypothetical protein
MKSLFGLLLICSLIAGIYWLTTVQKPVHESDIKAWEGKTIKKVSAHGLFNSHITITFTDNTSATIIGTRGLALKK